MPVAFTAPPVAKLPPVMLPVRVILSFNVTATLLSVPDTWSTVTVMLVSPSNSIVSPPSTVSVVTPSVMLNPDALSSSSTYFFVAASASAIGAPILPITLVLKSIVEAAATFMLAMLLTPVTRRSPVTSEFNTFVLA